MRFTIRDLLWLMTLVAVTLGLGIAWMRDSYHLATEINEMNRTHHAEMERVERAVNDAWETELKRQVERLENERGEPESAKSN